ncbi:MAG TPA: T9SS type A sorting domain-containing protein [Flavobacteriales bacterium]|jgi:hypothetical protein|nr:T9SS type A sorting domain-containing protein [Flavobacteriales bacterium]HNK83910.1 T9SS type A sorting domain-containing protein [Flavobacteriales bacterium]HNO03725.1 T9SS type A sorting domain-containing protein [Flavobacteriales bacterium]
MRNCYRTVVLTPSVLLIFSMHAQSPGGHATNLRAWYKANANAYRNSGVNLCTNGQTVRQWNDQSGNALTLTQATSGQRPTWYDGSGSVFCNYNPSIRFSDHYLQRTGSGGSPGVLVSGTTYNQLNLYAVYYDNNANNFDWLFNSGGNNGFNRVSLSMNWSGSSDFDCDVTSTTNRITTSTSSVLPVAHTNIIAVKSDNTGIYGGSPASSNKIQAFCNGTPDAARTTHTPIAVNNNITQIGDNELVTTDALDEPFGGDAMEFILYTGPVSQVVHQRIETYLALKYSVTLTSHDYFNTAGTNIFALSGGYTQDIIGVIRDDGQGLYQKQSRQQDDSARIYIGTLSATNVGNAATMAGDRQSLVIGHNGAAMRSSVATSGEIPGGAGLISRIAREWKVTNTAYTGTFSLAFKLNTSPIVPGDLRLLVDDDGNFTNASVNGNPEGLTFTYSGGIVTVTGISTTLVPTNSTRYITLASVANSTPLPIELLYFHALPADPDAVQLLWSTASERDNAFFEVQRSRSGVTYETIGSVDGNGNSTTTIAYEFNDPTPYPGPNYYRLKQVDLDGTSTFTEVRSVTIGADGPIHVYPNPAVDQVRIAGLLQGSTDPVEVYNAAGERMPFAPEDMNEGLLDVSTLPKGIYLVRIGDQVARVVKE